MKKRMSILIVVLLVLILIFSSFANAYANPLAPLIGSQFGRAAMTTVISGMMLKDLTEQTMITWDSVMQLVDVTKWYFGQHSGGYGLSIPKEDLDTISLYIYNSLNSLTWNDIQYDSFIYKAILPIPSDVMSVYIAQPFSYRFIKYSNIYNRYDMFFSNQPFILDSTAISWTGYTYNKCVRPDGSMLWQSNFQAATTGFDSSNVLINYQGLTKPIILEGTFDSRYITETGLPNYEGWMEQPGNRYIVNIPTTTDGLGNLIVDDVALDNQTQDLARVSDRLTELQEVPVNDVETWNPVPPTTNPVTDPITDVASESWLDRLWGKFVDLFILPDDYFIKNFQYLKNEVPMMAFPLQIINDVERMSTLQGGYLDDIWADGWGGHHKIVDFQFLRDMLPTFHNFLRGIMFILLLMYNYDQVYKLIRGNSYGFGHSRQEIIPQQIESPFKSLGRS